MIPLDPLAKLGAALLTLALVFHAGRYTERQSIEREAVTSVMEHAAAAECVTELTRAVEITRQYAEQYDALLRIVGATPERVRAMRTAMEGQ